MNCKTVSSMKWVTLLALALTQSAWAMSVVDEKLNIYGVVHASIDYMDSDVSDEQADASQIDKLSSGDVSISSNSSRIGFNGQLPVSDELKMLYQFEQAVSLEGSSLGSLGSRNSYLGIQGHWGEFLVGRYDTPFKIVGVKYTLFMDTVADRGNILGAGNGEGEQLNRRAENMMLWRRESQLMGGQLNWMLQYSSDAVKSPGIVDANERAMWGAFAQWQTGGFSLAMGYDHWRKLLDSEIKALRIAAQQSWGAATVSVLYETISQDLVDGSQGVFDRDAYSANVSFNKADYKYIAQIMAAEDYADSSDTGAVVVSAGVEKYLSKTLKLYTVYTQTDNDTYAQFQGVDGSHGDEIATLPGGSPKAISIGAKFIF